jgi:Na+/proline symporter
VTRPLRWVSLVMLLLLALFALSQASVAPDDLLWDKVVKTLAGFIAVLQAIGVAVVAITDWSDWITDRIKQGG